MGKNLFDNESTMAGVSAGTNLLVPITGTKQWTTKDENGFCRTLPGIRNFNTADVVANAADTYLTGSSIAIPVHLLQAGTMFRWKIYMTKTNAGTAAPIWIVRVGTNGSTADTARLTFTQIALQTAAIDAGVVEIVAILRNTGAAGVLAGGLEMTHVLAATGFSTLTNNILQVTSAGFDTTVASSIVGVSVNPGASGVWTHQVVLAEAHNI